MRKILIFFLVLFCVNFLWAEEKKEKKDEPPQKDYYHENFDEMDEAFEKKLENENKDTDDDLELRPKKSFYY
ncbi:MAG TPA: hypothetical protein DHW82_08670 [Spirochaetia bacterium]|nr:MAG: hypothetical protein A2Y41_05030 [Spirochaetes bacterium GWB1_36_13]HCL57063.1 hypothetical protein [Spirochaetia bacterium]